MDRQIFNNAKRLVIKVGSALLTNDGAGIDRQAIDAWVEQIAKLLSEGKEVVLVSSGAVAEGLARLGIGSRPQSIHMLQSAAAVGQMGVPATLTNILIGTESGCLGKLAKPINKPARSFCSSPMPTMPPEQTFIPDFRTLERVSNRS